LDIRFEKVFIIAIRVFPAQRAARGDLATSTVHLPGYL